MSNTTPDTLLKLASELSTLGTSLSAAGTKLAAAATCLEQEAANIALLNAQKWGIDVQVAVRTGPGVYNAPGQGKGGGHEVVINGVKK
ncbi:hypothetical protein COCSADRAFT_352245 [Bipolaris sorokiniana ND90Pr]|uniref:Uncharacterized protein n=1 Tax=Cochliobolus sativus (strain ND90Pr / ATCC 201652) TaxID=665912 RepID=M2SJL9_COCSN|nr:uncharacterized protein COCSADRAFT_352245 [Bipolaris sorokiniana ND90Pr]EMD67383.1 hypothetical protein COCSADRAFT_352245 [Bipolaris sorokiniana ND90Pr]